MEAVKPMSNWDVEKIRKDFPVLSQTVNGKPLDDQQTYTLATTSYVAEDAGDGYSMFKGAMQLIPKAQQPFESDILQKAIQSVPAIAPILEGRITRVDSAKNQSSCN